MTWVRHNRLLLVLLLAGLILAGWINLPAWQQLGGSDAHVEALPVAPAFRSGQRVLMLSPHPDDETLCCAGVIQQAHGLCPSQNFSARPSSPSSAG